MAATLDQLQLALPNLSAPVTVQTNPQFGHYTSNCALTIFGQLDPTQKTKFHNPLALADQIAQSYNQHFAADGITASTAAPGFINFAISDQKLVAALATMLPTNFDISHSDQSQRGQKVIVEYTDPNPFKELHIGHLFSNSVGEAISRLLAAQGHTVKRACYQGDVGLHVAKSLWGMQQLLAAENSEVKLESAATLVDSNKLLGVAASSLDPIQKLSLSEKAAWMGRAYALGSAAYEEDEKVQTTIKRLNAIIFLAAQQRVAKQTDIKPVVDYRQLIPDLTQDELNQIYHLYTKGREWSLEYFDHIYARLGTHFDYFFFESEVGELGWQIVKDYLAHGLFAKGEGGAIIFPGQKYGLHDRVFINSLGLPTYEAKELGLPRRKAKFFDYDRSLLVTGNEIAEYFKVVLAALKQIEPELAAKTTHITHGMVRLPEGKMSSRKGNVLTAEWLLQTAAQKISQHLAQNRPEMSEPERQQLADKLGLAAVKFALLRSNVGSDIAFDFDESLSFSGFSGPYVMYMLVRCKSLLAKAQIDLSPATLNSTITKHLDILRNLLNTLDYSITPDQKDLLRYLLHYTDRKEQAAQELAPHHICRHLFETAQAFSRFYDSTPILKEKDENKKQLYLLMTIATHQVLAQGLNLLGIPVVDKM